VGHLRKLGRMAIWNREKIIILIAIGVWLTDVGFLVNGEYLLLIKEVFLTNPVISQVAYG
jgi:multisubunit Na+/H+ antiporter MnhG subunit